MPGLPQVVRWRQFLDRIFDLRAHGDELNVLDDVMATVELVDATDPEMRRVRGDDWCSYGDTTARQTTAANAVKHWLTNPSGSGRIMVLEKLLVSNVGAGNQFFQLQVQNLTGAPGVLSRGWKSDGRDSGFNPSVQAVGEVRVLVDAAVPTGQCVLCGYAWNNGTATPDVRGIVLAPGTGVTLFAPAGAVNNLAIAWAWRERPVEASELL